MGVRRIGVAALAVGMLVGLAACGGGDPQAASVTSATESASPTAASTAQAAASSPSASPANATIDAPSIPIGGAANSAADYCRGQAPAHGPVADQFGADMVMVAYCELVTFTLDESSFINSLLVPKDGEAALNVTDFALVKPYMTPRMQTAWDQSVAAALGGDEERQSSVNALTFYAINGEGWEFSDTPTLVGAKRWGPAHLDSDNNGPDGEARLNLRFQVSAEIRATLDGAPKTVPVNKTMSYWLVPTGQSDIPWAIDAYQGSFKFYT
ncbi:hypothetical protein [Modestobacter sp. SYSU DS0657]